MPPRISRRRAINRTAARHATPIDPARSLRHETLFAGMVAALLSVLAFGYCFPRSLLLLYGDAVAHLHIARRILDSLNPGIRQIGSVWLPFPHLLMMPFAARMAWWQNGIAGAIPSMACYVLSVAGLWRLSRYWLRPAGAVVATLFFALNPGLLYMQTTAMNEPLFLCQMIWSALFLTTFLRGIGEGNHKLSGRALTACGLVLVTATYTRYDAWIFATIAWLIAVTALARARAWKSRACGAFVLFTAMLVTAPVLWFAWNARQYGDWLDFMRGPYSAKAIELRTATPGAPMYPGWHSIPVAALYFLKAAELGVVSARWADFLFALIVAGTVLALVFWRKRNLAPMLLLWLPLPFYAYSIAYGSVPIFIPLWWPHSFYNTRYGMEMLPIFALCLGFLAAWLLARAEKHWPRHAQLILLASIVLIMLDAVALIRATPLVLGEAIANARTRIPFEAAYARALDQLPPQGTILVWTSDHIGAFQRAAIPLRRTINETDYYQWKAALAHPAQSAQWVIAADHDAVAQSVAAHPQGLTLFNIVCSTGQPCVKFYRSDVYHSH
ncbi:MAG: glycosyltransferase family 39 protein [Acidobacteriaceae bacterium]